MLCKEYSGAVQYPCNSSLPSLYTSRSYTELLLRLHLQVSGNARTATLMKDWVIEATSFRDRPFVRAFMETQMFQVRLNAAFVVVPPVVLGFSSFNSYLLLTTILDFLLPTQQRSTVRPRSLCEHKIFKFLIFVRGDY